MIRYYNLRGTSGTGKTTVARALINKSNAKPAWFSEGEYNNIKKLKNGRVLGLEGRWANCDIILLGNYDQTCGGCDTIPSVKIVAHMLGVLHEDYSGNPAAHCLVFFEGLMISHMIGTVGNKLKELNLQGKIGFLDTPLDTALVRVQDRRDSRGDTRPFNPDNTIKDYRAVEMCKQNCYRQGFPVEVVTHLTSIDHVMQSIHSLCGEMTGEV